MDDAVGGLLRIAATAFLKKRDVAVTTGWDNNVGDASLNSMIRKVITRMHQEDTARSKWCVEGPELDVGVDASSLATVVSLEYNRATMVDLSWL